MQFNPERRRFLLNTPLWVLAASGIGSGLVTAKKLGETQPSPPSDSLQQFPMTGFSYSPEYSNYIGNNSQLALNALLQQLDPSILRFGGRWSVVLEGDKYKYKYRDTLDWQFNAAKGKVIIFNIGMKVFRYPEFHLPDNVKQWAPDTGIVGSNKDLADAAVINIREGVQFARNYPDVKIIQIGNESLVSIPEANWRKEALLTYIRQLEEARKYMRSDQKLLTTHPLSFIPDWIHPEEREAFRIGLEYSDIVGINFYNEVPFLNLFDISDPGWLEGKVQSRQDDAAKKGKPLWASEVQAENWVYKNRISKQEQVIEISPTRLRILIDILSRNGIKVGIFWGAENWYKNGKDGKVDTSMWVPGHATPEQIKLLLAANFIFTR